MTNVGWEISICTEWESVCGNDPLENEKLQVGNYNPGVGKQYLHRVVIGLWD
jgi:hypothetical protein